MFIASVLVSRFSVIASVVDTGDKFLTGVNVAGEQLSTVTMTPAINLSPVTMTPVLLSPAINLLPVTRTRTPWKWGAAKDGRKLKRTNR